MTVVTPNRTASYMSLMTLGSCTALENTSTPIPSVHLGLGLVPGPGQGTEDTCSDHNVTFTLG